MKPYDSRAFDQAMDDAQGQPSGILPEMTVRDEANALIVGAVRNDKLFESLHAGRREPLLEDPGVSRITDAEMKQLMIRFSATLAWFLHLRNADREEYRRQVDFFGGYTRSWERRKTGRHALEPSRGGPRDPHLNHPPSP